MFYYGRFMPGQPLCGQITTPAVYTEDLSIAQQIARIFNCVKAINNRLESYLSLGDFQDFLDWLEKEQDSQTTALQTFALDADSELETRLLKMIGDIAKTTLIWDVSRGGYYTSREAIPHLFEDVTFRGYSVGEFNSLSITVGGLAECGLNCRGMAVASTWLTQEFPLTQSYLIVELPHGWDCYTHQQVVDMGLAPKPIVTDRDYTTGDLANSYVRSNDDVYTIKE